MNVQSSLNRDAFKSKFELPQGEFLEAVDLQDTKIGFSFYKKSHEKGFKSLFHVYIKDSDIDDVNQVFKPVVISVSYGADMGDGISVYSSEFKRQLNWPINLISEDDYFYKVKTNDFYTKDRKVITGIDILKEVDSKHIKPTKFLDGLFLRLEMYFYYRILSSFFSILFKIFAEIQYLVSGQQIQIYDKLNEHAKLAYVHQPDFSDSRLRKHIKIFEYEVEYWIALLYSSLHLVVFLVFQYFDIRPNWVVSIFRNNFLTTMYVVISLGLANTILFRLLDSNKILYPLLGVFQNLYTKSINKKIRL